MRLECSTEKDLPTIDSWLIADPGQRAQCVYNRAYLTGSPNSMLVFRLDDSIGPTMFVRCEQDPTNETLVRMHILFGDDTVSNSRIARAIYKTLPVIIKHFMEAKFHGMIFDSVSVGLVQFLERFGFKSIEGTNDYLLTFEVPALVA
jgi:hypothetical protein